VTHPTGSSGGRRPGGPLRTYARTYVGKRILDLTFVALVAVPALVIGIVCALAIKLDSSGPALFRQERIGRHGRIFRIRKFRTMVTGDNPVIPAADLITPVGRFLRRTSLDELPQLIDVALGHMSVVGPRPTLAYQADRWTNRQRQRLDARPGLTGLAQVCGRNDLSWDERIEYDLDYLDRQSMWLDLAIMRRTVGTLLSGSGGGTTAADDPLARVGEQIA
jgi:lipopolysaccharide/colanic/teichoic acid biosynthesis glycosyltransferase